MLRDALRILTLLGYLSAVAVGIWALAETRSQYRRLKTKLVVGGAMAWSLLFAWRTYAFWGDKAVSSFVHDISGILDRFASMYTALVFLLIPAISFRAEHSAYAQIQEVADRLKDEMTNG